MSVSECNGHNVLVFSECLFYSILLNFLSQAHYWTVILYTYTGYVHVVYMYMCFHNKLHRIRYVCFQVLSLMSDMKDSRDQLESVTTGGQSPGKRDSEGEKPATWGTTISEVLENNNDLFF